MWNKLWLLFIFGSTGTLGLSWDIAVTTNDQIIFYNNGVETNRADVLADHLTALAYDSVYNILFFVDNRNDASIFSYSLATKKIQKLITKESQENIQDIAFDPVSGTLYWTDYGKERSVFSGSLKFKKSNVLERKKLIELNLEIPRAVTVDSCRGYIYWTNTNTTTATIERSRFDGSHREIVRRGYGLHNPVSITIDQRTKRLYWIDDKPGIHFTVESSDLDGSNQKLLYSGIHHAPNALTVSKDSIYWIDFGFNAVWKLPKTSENNKHEPVEVMSFSGDKKVFGIAANYQISDQTVDTSECEALLNVSQNKILYDSFNVREDCALYCLHGVEIEGDNTCNCTMEYLDDIKECNISTCHNYCLNGNCTLNTDGNPQCRCEQGFYGERCELNECKNYCLNDGVCAVDTKYNKLHCTCTKDYQGDRCEIAKSTPTEINPDIISKDGGVHQESACDKYCLHGSCFFSADNKPICRCDEGFTGQRCEINACTNFCLNSGECVFDKESNKPNCRCINGYSGERCNIKSKDQSSGQRSIELTASRVDDNSVESCRTELDQWDPVRDPVIITLAILCLLFCAACVVFIRRIMHLQRRPRIKKRIIVNKNTTPLTSRPQQCEITIEDCCNMNICETPCFEPQSTIRPTLIEKKSGKEEKKNLLMNMEHNAF